MEIMNRFSPAIPPFTVGKGLVLWYNTFVLSPERQHIGFGPCAARKRLYNTNAARRHQIWQRGAPLSAGALGLIGDPLSGTHRGYGVAVPNRIPEFTLGASTSQFICVVACPGS